MEHLFIPQDYKSSLSIIDTEIAIKLLKDYFELTLAERLNLTRVSAPLFVTLESGLNDNLSGIERPVAFDVKGIKGSVVEIVHSLAKWKRMALKKYGFQTGEGIYTDMNAIRRDEDLDNIHSFYVDQWDWERIINKEDRTVGFLKNIVANIFNVFKETEDYICSIYHSLERYLPDDIFFITSQELEECYPDLTPTQRECAITREKKAVFLIGIGDLLKSGFKHDVRAPDYDDWKLNGDILFWYPVLNRAIELSSMGIRVDEGALIKQLQKADCNERQELPFHRDLLEGRLPLTIGGGIGQSRLCMFFLGKAHIGEVHASIWDDKTTSECQKSGIQLL